MPPVCAPIPAPAVPPLTTRANRKTTAASKKTASNKTASKKTASKKTASKKTASKKTASNKTASKKTASEKTASNKTASNKTASKKTASNKTASNKTASNKTASNKTASNKTASNKTASNKTASNKTASNKTASNKTASNKTASKKTASNKTASKKTASNKTASNKTASNKTAGGVPVHNGTVTEAVRERAAEMHRRLKRAQPAPQVELDHRNAYELLIATILAARSNDRTINTITPELFRRWPKPADLAEAPQDEVEVVVKRSGFFRNKAKAIRKTAQALVAEFDGEVPNTLPELTTLPGVARKTANVVLNTVFRINSGIIVDVHVTRLVERFGFTTEKDATRIEALLCVLFPKTAWADVGHRIVLHGRHVCTARAPRCTQCPLAEVCPSVSAEPAGRWTERAAWEQVLTESRGETDPSR